MENVYYIDSGIGIYRTSIVSSEIETSDEDDNGNPITNGKQRSLSVGIGIDGQLYIWMETNCGARPCYEHDLDWYRDMGDAQDSDDEQIRTGAARLLDACDWAATIWRTEEAIDHIDWYRIQADWAMAQADTMTD